MIDILSVLCLSGEAITKGSYNPQDLEIPTKAGPPCGDAALRAHQAAHGSHLDTGPSSGYQMYKSTKSTIPLASLTHAWPTLSEPPIPTVT